MTFLLPNLIEGVAYEPSDICGKRIKFDIPRRLSEVTKGEFVVPGQYSQFVISAPSDVEIRLEITGFLSPDPSPYFVHNIPSTNFYVRINGRKVLAYTNTLTNFSTGRIVRTVAPSFVSLERMIVDRYRACPFESCVGRSPVSVMSNGSQTRTIVTLRSRYYSPGSTTMQDLQNCAGTGAENCGTLYSLLKIIPPIVADNPLGLTIVGTVGGDSHLFTLSPGRTFRISFTLTGTSPSYNDYVATGGDLPFPGGRYRNECGTEEGSALNLTLINEGVGVVNYIEGSQPAPPTTDSEIVVPLRSFPIDNSTQDSKVPFSTPSRNFSYVFKSPDFYGLKTYFLVVNNPKWEYSDTQLDLNPCGGDIDVTFTIAEI